MRWTPDRCGDSWHGTVANSVSDRERGREAALGRERRGWVKQNTEEAAQDDAEGGVQEDKKAKQLLDLNFH